MVNLIAKTLAHLSISESQCDEDDNHDVDINVNINSEVETCKRTPIMRGCLPANMAAAFQLLHFF
jgi:hypothetical protein